MAISATQTPTKPVREPGDPPYGRRGNTANLPVLAIDGAGSVLVDGRGLAYQQSGSGVYS